MMNKKYGKVLFVLGCVLILICVTWFFGLITIANPDVYQQLGITKGIQNKTKEVTINYKMEFDEPLTIVSDTSDQRTVTIDISGIISGIIVGFVMLIIGKILNRVWPDIKNL